MRQQGNVQEIHQDQLEVKPVQQQKNQAEVGQGRVRIDFYTDPLCCWSWAFEKPWRQLLDKFGDRISYRYIMGGMIADWNSYSDDMNAVSRPLQMGPVWMHASEVTHVKMRYDIWHLNPPASSYPACIAVKTASLQSDDAADAYLLAIRKALMEQAEDISRHDVLFSVAKNVKELDADKFIDDWNNGRGKNLFRQDMQQAKYHNIGRFPTLTFVNESEQGLMIVGYRPIDVLQQAFEQILTPEILQNAK